MRLWLFDLYLLRVSVLADAAAASKIIYNFLF